MPIRWVPCDVVVPPTALAGTTFSVTVRIVQMDTDVYPIAVASGTAHVEPIPVSLTCSPAGIASAAPTEQFVPEGSDTMVFSVTAEGAGTLNVTAATADGTLTSGPIIVT